MPKSRKDQAVRERVQNEFGRIWPVHLAGFTELLVRLRAEFDGDLDLMLVLAVIADRTPPDTWKPALDSFRKLSGGPTDTPGQTPIYIQSVSDYTSIPRETVRRKISKLQRKGWIVRHPDGHLSVSEKAATDLEAGTGHTIDYLVALFRAYDAVRENETRPA
jgi:hypothetical protein